MATHTHTPHDLDLHHTAPGPPPYHQGARRGRPRFRPSFIVTPSGVPRLASKKVEPKHELQLAQYNRLWTFVQSA
eukprot:scaffold14085_cov142-Isochrysis_galbana.AAC.2